MRYLLSTEQMIENDYPIPSYLADVFTKTDGWVETPGPPENTGTASSPDVKPRLYSIDCEMVCIILITMLTV